MPEALSLAVGDRVVYPNQGLCKVTGIETKDIAGQKLSFVTLRREEDGAKVMVPEAKVVAIGVRKVADASEVAKVLKFLESDSDKASLDWKARARTNVERMSIGGLIGLAEVVKGLAVLSELRPLPTKERELYNDARHLLVTELAASLKISEADAEDTVDVVLFPPGKERPKRLADEFRAPSEGDDDLGLEGDLLGIDGEVAEESTEAEEPAEEEPADLEAADEKQKAKGLPQKAAKAPTPTKPKTTQPPAKPKKSAPPSKAKKAARPSKAKSAPVAAKKKKK